MIKKGLKTLILIGLVSLFVFATPANAILWGKVDITTDRSTHYLDRYVISEIPITVRYKPTYVAFILPATVTVRVTQSAPGVEASISKKNLLVDPESTATTSLILAPSSPDMEAGPVGTVTIEATGLLPLGRNILQLDPTSVDISIAYNPFTEIAVSFIKPLEETTPDTRLSVPVEVYNYGNNVVGVDLTVVETPGDWNYALSVSHLRIPPKGTEQTTYPHGDITLTLNSPHGTAMSYHNDWEGLTLKAVARSEMKEWLWEGSSWSPSPDYPTMDALGTFLSKNKGFYVPGFEIFVAMAAIGLAMIAIRKRKKT